MMRNIPSFKTVAVSFIAGIFLIQILSLLISEVFPSVPILKGGNAILLILLSSAVITLFVISFKVDQLKRKETLIFLIIIFGLVVLAYWKLPEFFPQLFNIDPSFSNAAKQAIGSIIG